MKNDTLKGMRKLLIDTIRSLAGKYKSRGSQMLLDAASNVDLSGPIDESRLPVLPEGFFLKQHTVLRHSGIPKRQLIEFQWVAMAILYFWLYSATGDRQDHRSCYRYCRWIQRLVENYNDFEVVGDVRHGWYLSDAKSDPKPPSWLQTEEGETV